jgi:deaminated glutathione amidase
MWIAALQLNTTPDIAENLAKARKLVIRAAERGAELVALPEHFAYLGPEDENPPSAQPLNGPLVTEFAGLAQKLGIFLLYGVLPRNSRTRGAPL